MNYRNANERRELRHDLLFSEANKFGDYISIKEVKNDPLKPAWHTFQLNIDSILAMTVLPQAVARSAVEHLLPLTQAVFNILGKPVMDDTELEPYQQKISEEYSRIVREFFDGRQAVRHTFAKDLVIYNKYNLVNAPLTKGGFYALLESQIVGVWTAFDAFTTDLCVAVVNAKPELLERFGKRQTTLDNLLQSSGDHDWRGRMGELVKVFARFDSFSGTKDAYKQLFDNKSINDAIDSTGATAASLVRNQITHDAGMVTDSFVKQAKKNKLDPWQTFPAGTRLALDGRNVSALSEGVVHCANNLIRAVDDWLKLPPPKS